MITTGLVSITFRKLSTTEIIQLTKRAGLDAIEWGGDVHVPVGDLRKAEEVFRTTVEAGLTVAAYGSYYRLGAAEMDFAPVLETATVLHAPRIRVWAGQKGSAEADDGYRQIVAEDAARISELASASNISISAEYHDCTLTDSNESAMQLSHEVPHPNFDFYWQPPNGCECDYCAAGLEALLPRISNVHVFHWWPDHHSRHLLEEGNVRWARYFQILEKSRRDHAALLEHVKDDSTENFLRDAETLKRLVSSPSTPSAAPPRAG